jgi:hypothetical protein
MFLALDILDEVIGTVIVESEVYKYQPEITLIAVGGFVNVCTLRSRDTTPEMNYFMDPYTPNYAEMESLLKESINIVAERCQFSPEWAKDFVGPLPMGAPRERVADASVKQDDMIFDGVFIRIYAAQ